MTTGVSLGWLLQPLTVETFLTEIWATRHYVINRCCPGYFDGVFDAAAIEEYLEFARPERSEVRLIRTADRKAPETYRLADDTIDLVRIRNEFADGYTIVLNGLERHVPNIAALAHAIEVELNFETQVNVYITPPKSQGFLPHYDDHDVLILQISGTKTWHVYDSVADVPSHELRLREMFVKDGLPAPSDLTLEAGDVLYLPRGRVHAAEANDEPSIHLTLGIHPPSVLALVTKALEALGYRDDRVLTRLPPRYLNDASARTNLGGLVRDVVGAIDESCVGDAIGALEDSLLRRGRCQLVGHLIANSFEADRIDGRTRVMKCQPLYSRVLALDGGVALQFAQSMVSAGPEHRAAMLFLSRNTEPFRVGDLPGLSAPQQTELARKLVVDGFLIRVPED